VTRGGRLSVAAADTSVAFAQLLAARALQNPALSAAYSKSPPQYHFTVELPIDLPSLRSARIGAAQAALKASSYKYTYERAAASLDADTTYTRALAAAARARLSSRNASVADTLLEITIARRTAGDASDLDVELARVNAGQERNLAIADSLELISVLTDLATVTALPSGAVIALADTLALPDTVMIPPGSGDPLQIAAGLQSVLSAERTVKAEHRSVFGSPALMAGIETHDPEGTEKGILPTFGITLPIPLLNRNRAGIMTANAELTRARAELSITRVEYAASLSHLRRRRATAYSRVIQDRALLASANRVASMSVRAYREGAVPIANVFEAQRSARDVLRQYVDDLADVWIADAMLRVLTLTATK
jgi:cobalt-zinc-cadmium efflux system outer membrane protein